MAEERFKTTLMGGFDKDDVLNQVREMKDAAYAEKSKLIKEKKEQAKQIQELKKQLAKKDSEKAAALQKQKAAHKEEIATSGRTNSGKTETERKNWSVRSAKNIKNILTAMI